MSSQTGTKEKVAIKVTVPPNYAVILHNDNVTTMDFVVAVLVKLFNKSIEDAIEITMEIHTKGAARVGIFSKEMAVQKVEEVTMAAAHSKYPLKASYEKE
jgi:ATP-dependent Clp protease adaptor protein ClpS